MDSFDRLQYARVKIYPLPDEVTALAAAISAAASEKELAALYKQLDAFKSRIYTMQSIAYVRHTIDTRDAFYRAENDYYDQYMPAVEELLTRISRSLLGHRFRSALEEQVGSLAFRNMEILEKAVGPEIVEDMRRENALATEYQALTASARIDFGGKKVNLPQLAAYQEHPDRAVREAAFRAEGSFYAANKEKLDGIFDALVKLRDGMAKKMGFASYTEMAYHLRVRNCYGRAEVERFREQVVRYVVPAVTGLLKKRDARCGIADPKYWDRKLIFKDGNPVPEGTPEEIFQAGRKMYEELSPETGEFIRFMLQYGLFDVLSKEGKANGGYCTGFQDFKAPFVFANFNGTQGDVEVLTHECGHAFEGYIALRTMEYLDQQNYTADIAEIHSMSMERFTYPWMKLFFKEKADRFYYSHLLGTLTLWPYGSMVDHFQHIVYDNPGLSPDERNAEWLKLEKIYRPDADFADLPHYCYGGMWQRQLHIYQYPFYYIDYCLAQYAASGFWMMMNEHREKAWETYLALVKQSGLKDYRTLVEEAGFDSPFEGDSLARVVRETEEYLNGLEERIGEV